MLIQMMIYPLALMLGCFPRLGQLKQQRPRLEVQACLLGRWHGPAEWAWLICHVTSGLSPTLSSGVSISNRSQ